MKTVLLIDDNNEILVAKGDASSPRRFIISDLGATFGKTGGFFSRSRNEPSDYVKAEFVQKLNGDVIDFSYSGKNQKLFENLTISDARWVTTLVAKLSDEQLKDAFRSANYSADEVNQLAQAFRDRSNKLAALAK